MQSPKQEVEGGSAVSLRQTYPKHTGVENKQSRRSQEQARAGERGKDGKPGFWHATTMHSYELRVRQHWLVQIRL